MIFSKKIYKLVSGKNLTLYPKDKDTFEIFVFDKISNKYEINLRSQTKAKIVSSDISYNQITKLNESHSCVCYDKNLSIVKNERENL